MPTRSDNAKTLLDNLLTAVILMDERLCIQFVNPAAEQLLSLSERRLIGIELPHLLEHISLDLQRFKQCLISGQGFTDSEVTLVVEGEPRLVEISVSPMADHEQRLMVVELRKIDQQKKISQELQQHAQQQAAKELVRGLAHEIKNPLGGIRGAAQLLARQLPDEGLRDYTNVIIEEADRLRNLVDRMLGSNKLPLLAMTNVHEVLERVCNLVEAETQGSITLVRDYDPSLPDLLIDREQMIQAVLNIVRNAMQAIGGQNELRLGRITLRTRAMRQFTIGHIRHRLVTKIEIIDNGPGIPAELQDTLFFPMVSGRPDGTGLGLAITQNIISQHQGLIECESHPGHTLFSIFLPLEQGAAST